MMGNSAFSEMMLTDLIPMIEKTYRALPGAANRAMAGLSMGGMQTHNTTMANLEALASPEQEAKDSLFRRRAESSHAVKVKVNKGPA